MFVLMSLLLLVGPEAASAAPPAAHAPTRASPPATASTPAPKSATAPAPAPAATAPPHDLGASFKTTKTLGELERCLTDRLSKFGEVTSVPIEGMKTLMFRTTDEPPMMIDISPPTVTVTTKFAVWTKPIIQTCM
jgi:hypothetical protein